MIRRILAASILSIATAIAGFGVVAQAATAPSATSTVSGVTQTVQTTTTTQATAPTIDCGTGIVATVCAVVLGPICRDRCFAAGAPHASTATGTGTVARSVGTPAAATSPASVRFDCSIDVLCVVFGVICPHCTFDTAATVEQPRTLRET